MSASNYDDILNRAWDEVPEVELLPGGTYMLVGQNIGLVKPREEGQSAKILFSYTVKEPVSVDQDALDALPEGYELSNNDVFYTVYLESAKDLAKVRKHLALHGIDVEGPIMDDNGKFAAGKAFRGSEIVAELGQRNYENNAGETVWQNTVGKFQSVEV